MLRRKFAVIKFWPHAKAAEDEVIARLKIAAELIGLECLVVDSFARLIHPPHTQLTRDDVDFVLSLHFEAPKRFDIFSFVTLWNPLQFYSEWGYRKCTRHLLTHDDGLSTDSASGDDHVMRFFSRDPKRARPVFPFYPTVSGPILEPTLGDKKLFYAGINWERSANRPARHSGLLGLLDELDDFRIYGPKIFNGVEVWHGYKSYVSPIPFDGVSMVRLINLAGISLVLSSPAHLQEDMMSCRLFESAAAGAVIICCEHPFSRRHFGDSLLYIDTSRTPEETYGQVRAHLDWIKTEPAKALEKARQAQKIFCDHLRLDTCIERIYKGLPARKAELEALYAPKRPQEKICAVFLMPEFHSEILEQHIASCRAQKNVAIRGIVAMDASDVEIFGPRVRSRLSDCPVPLEVVPVHFMERRSDGSLKGRKLGGEVLSQVIRNLVQEDYVCIVAPHERLFSDHLSSLLRTLQDAPDAGCAWCDMLQSNGSKDNEQADLCDDPDVAASAAAAPIGFGRFLFRRAALDERIHTALPYLDTLAMHLLLGTHKSQPSGRCTLLAAVADGVSKPYKMVSPDLERDILIDFAPDVFRIKASSPISQPQVQPQLQAPPPATLSLDRMTPEERTKLAVELAHSIPIPSFLKNIAFGVYRFWFRWHARSRESS